MFEFFVIITSLIFSVTLHSWSIIPTTLTKLLSSRLPLTSTLLSVLVNSHLT